MEAVWAVTTTGLTTLSSMETRPASFLFCAGLGAAGWRPGHRRTDGNDDVETGPAAEKHEGPVKDLELSDNTRVIAITRGDDSQVATDDTKISKNDEVFLITE